MNTTRAVLMVVCPQEMQVQKMHIKCWLSGLRSYCSRPSTVRVTARFTSPCDTVLGTGVETTKIPELTLGFRRRLELFLSVPSSAATVRNRIQDVFLKAYKSGMFHVLAKRVAKTLSVYTVVVVPQIRGTWMLMWGGLLVHGIYFVHEREFNLL